MSELKVNKLSPRSGTAVTLGDSGDTFTIPSGATLAIAGSVTGFTSAGIDDNATSVAITIDSNENVGIGTTSPNNYSGYGNLTLGGTSGGIFDLEVNGTRTGSLLGLVGETRLASITNIPVTFQVNNAEKMRLNSTGLGIGTSNPSEKLEIAGTGTQTLKIDRTDASTAGAITINSANSSNYIYNLTSKNLVFGTNNNARMTIDGSGNVGIGTSSPSTSLHISQSVPIITLTDTDTSVSHQLSGQSGSRHFNLKVDTGGSSGSPVFNLSMQDSIKLSVLNDGNVGIGTDSPSQKLDVVGSIEVSDGIYIGGTAAANKLDDYEEGTWTPAVNSGTASAFYATYTKVGNQCTLHFYLQNFSDTTSSTTITITGLPFTQDTSGTTVAGLGSTYGERFDYNARVVIVQSTSIKFGDGLGVSNFSTLLQYADCNDGSDAALIGSVTYQTT